MIKQAFDWVNANPEIVLICAVVFILLINLYEAYEGKKSIGAALFQSFVLVAAGIIIAFVFAM